MKNQDHQSKSLNIRVFTGILLMLISISIRSADIIEISPLTNRIIFLHFSEGHMSYPNSLNVVRLNLDNASKNATYSVISSNDTDFQTILTPSQIGRKSKGMEFVSNSGVPWGGSSFDPRNKPWASEHWIYLFLDRPMKTGMSYTLNTGNLAVNGNEWTFTFDEKVHRSEAVHVNTLGYAPEAPKFGYVYQWMGDKGNLSLSAYNGKKFWLYRDGEEEPVFQGTLRSRSSSTNPETGQPNDTPNRNFLGAEVYECDFSQVTAPGNYTLVVEDIGGSFPFTIGPDAIWEAYYHGARTLYHQRSGIRLHPPYTEEGYIRPVTQNTKVTSDDGTDFSVQLLYCTLPWVEWDQGEGGGSSLADIREASIGNNLEVAGWYHDAGDWDGYASHQRVPKLLMLTYEATPERFMDGDLNIPESGNGIPDIIDEASWLIKFNYRLRKELIAKGFSNGGVGGARVAPDFFSAVDGNAESNKPSWQDHRRYVITSADAYMTYMYAGQAAHFAYILKSLGKDPENFMVEMLDHVDFDEMTYDVVNWIKEAEEAWAWASDPVNQPSRHAHYSSQLWVYRMYGAASLYRLTGKEEYHQAAKEELEKVRNRNRLDEDERFGPYLYLLTNHLDVSKSLQSSLKDVAIANGNWRGVDATRIRGLRWGGVYDMPMLVGQGTTPWMFETIFAYAITGDKIFKDVVHTTTDYFLGSNPLHTTWMTGVGPRPARGGFHLDSRYLWNNNWMVYKGFVPYGPWSMAYGYNPFTWTIDGIEMQGGAGPWNKDWANFSMYPIIDQWPGHERYNNNIHAPMSTENTIHQQSVYTAIAYGFANNRKNSNTDAPVKVGSIELDKSEIIFDNPGDQAILTPTLDIDDASFPAMVWTSSDHRVAHVDGFGRVTGVTGGNATITVSTLDGSVLALCQVICNWEDTPVNTISVTPDNLTLVEGQSAQLTVTFDPPEATNQFVNWSYSEEGIAEVDEFHRLRALKVGTANITATSLKDEKTAQIQVLVEERTDYIIADFDVVIPVTTSPKPDIAQLYTPQGTNNVETENPLPGLANESERVFQWDRPAGDWRLFGMVLPTDHPQDMSRYSQFQFKYFGKDIHTFFIQLQTVEDTQIEINAQVEGEECWQLFSHDLNSDLTLKQFNVFANPTGGSGAETFYFDDFILAAEPALPFNEMQISETEIELEKGETFILSAFNQGNPFTWITSDPLIATVDQGGTVTAKSKGAATIKAVPLYGISVECEVSVIIPTESHELVNSNSFRIYPNPTQGNINIEYSQGIKMVEIYDHVGRLVFSRQTHGKDQIHINKADFGKGLYLVRITVLNSDQKVSKLMVW
jgi:endoglucanase